MALAALALGLPAMPLAAQSTFSLPPGQSTPTARPAGPFDPNDPTTSAARPRPTTTAAPTPGPAATPTSAAPATSAASSATPRAATTATPRSATRTTQATASAAPQAPASTAPGPLDSLALPGAAASAPPAADPFPTALPSAPSAAATPPAKEPSALPAWWPWAAGVLGLLAALGGLLFWRRRRDDAAPQIAFEPPVVSKQQPETASEPEPAPVAAPTPAPTPAPTAPVGNNSGLQLELVARRLDASLVAATLAYSLKVTNTGPEPLGALTFEADMVGAHASRPVEQQIASAEQRLEQRHALTELAPGESAEFKGEFRLPLAMITPIRAGNAAYFVPLVRLRVEAVEADAASAVLAQTFVVGELPDQPGGALRPLRLDLGPRTFARLGQRAVG
ncbi:hypothetical protein [Novosphingobium sp.]|jgi:hypothetical protein|uniref:hypothetical protein n=1 Tax=Novosphingobium sp. TaxID=1874826 RepID=UPI0022C8C522|nr:hypothetical protein [Novosphingobium sp.]MCZ8019322.1 hypothetical protein [Novosphingobium sp.]MCZ8035137.1 hypothetical protein [Novosphingobium sp.]MCZ8050451.1 hypothetical protein [Novosphingobium sp.]MCZ8058797.1 hypothetical protein [Novosphingobium sp.]MCZ8232242.1 hypothetical protein [Novosphingobium sp.]